jgi:hypothetical protein
MKELMNGWPDEPMGWRRSPSWPGAFLLLALVVLLGGCDRTPSGEGDWTATFEGPGGPFGAAVVMVSGEGVLGVTGAGGTLAWTEETGTGEVRAVLVQPEGSGGVRFRVRVRELSGPAPSVAIIELAGVDDDIVTVSAQHYLRLRR